MQKYKRERDHGVDIEDEVIRTVERLTGDLLDRVYFLSSSFWDKVGDHFVPQAAIKQQLGFLF